MTIEKETYPVLQDQFDSYAKEVAKRRRLVTSVIFVVVISLFSLISTRLDSEFPLIIYITVLGAIMLGAFLWGQKIWTKTLLKFKTATYELDNTEVQLKGEGFGIRSIQLDRLAVMDTTWKGTTLVEGNIWTKLDYYRPKKGSNSLDQKGRIFIPRVTLNYDVLLEKIKSIASNS